VIEGYQCLSMIEIDISTHRNWYKHSLVETGKSPLVSYHFLLMIETDRSLSSILYVIKIYTNLSLIEVDRSLLGIQTYRSLSMIEADRSLLVPFKSRNWYKFIIDRGW